MLPIKLNYAKQQRQLIITKMKMRNNVFTYSGKTMGEAQRQILTNSIVLSVSETKNKNPCVDTDCKLACQVICLQSESSCPVLKGWYTTLNKLSKKILVR